MKLVRDKKFYINILAIAIPIALQNLLSFGVNMADTVMLGLADETGVLLSATSLANQPFFILSLFVFGMSGAGAVLAAQYWGKKDMAAVRIVISMVLKISILVSFGFMLAILLLPRQIMQIYSNNDAIIAAGVEYLHVMGYAYLVFGITSTFICSLRSVEIVKIAVVMNMVSLLVNVFLNWVLIFGNLGFPALGITGAAIATLTTRLVEFCIVMIFVFVVDKKLKFRLKNLLAFDKRLFKDLMKHGSPVVVNELMWSLGISVQAAILGHISYTAGDPVAANSIAGTVQQLATIIIFGVANAAAVLIGKSIGEGRHEEARQKASTFTLLALIMGILGGAMILLLRNFAVDFFNFNEETKTLAKQMLIVMAFVVVFISYSSIYIVGIFRGAGDTRFCLVAEIISLWLVSTPAAWILAMVLQLPVPIVLIGMRSDEILKTILCSVRMVRGKWIKVVTRERPPEKPEEKAVV